MKNKAFLTSIAITALFFGVFGVATLAAQTANATIVPTLTLSVPTPGYTLLSVNADPNATVMLYYYTQIAGGETVTNGSLGTTNAYGYFSTTINDSSYNIPYNTPVYVTVDGQNSATVPWPNNSNGITAPSGGLTLSQTNFNLQIGQTVSVTATNFTYYGALTIVSNTNPTAISATVIGNQINVSGVNYGSAAIEVCQTNSNTCGMIYATVSTFTPVIGPVPTPIIYTQPLSFGNINASFDAGQSINVQIYGSGNYSLYNNSNPNVVSASLNGNWLYLYGNQPGTSNITVCENTGAISCANLPVDVIAGASWYQYPWQQSNSYWNNYYPSSYNPFNWNW